MTVAIVGAGVAGLTCARILHAKNVPVVVFEQSDRVGGRVRTDVEDGFRLDRGFQVVFTSYPAVRRQLDLNQLDLRRFQPGAIIARNGRRSVLSDPLRDPAAFLPAALNMDVTLLDKLRTLALTFRLRSQTRCQAIAGGKDNVPDGTTLAYLQRWGFSVKFIDNFIRPFYGGIFLDRSLQTSAKVFRYTFKMLSEGEAAVPATGVGRISDTLAAPVQRAGLLRLNTSVQALKREADGQVSGLILENGETFEAETVVVATAAPQAAQLTNQTMPTAYVSTACLYYSGPTQLYRAKKLVLNANPDAFINNHVLLTNIAPEYAPPGQHLLSASVLGQPDLDDDRLLQKGLEDLRHIWAGDARALTALQNYKPLAVKRVSYAQFAQPPAIHATLPDNATDTPGLIFAAEFTEASSLNAAMISGEKAARLIIGQRGSE